VTTPPAKARGFCLVAEAAALTGASQALRSLHPATLTPEGPIQAQHHLTTRMFYVSDDLSGFARFPLTTPWNILFSQALVPPRYYHAPGWSNRARLAADASFPSAINGGGECTAAGKGLTPTMPGEHAPPCLQKVGSP
jgi:hypothetical protein